MRDGMGVLRGGEHGGSTGGSGEDPSRSGAPLESLRSHQLQPPSDDAASTAEVRMVVLLFLV